MYLAQDYSYSVKSEHGLYVARVKEFSLLAAHGDSKDEALQELQDVVKFVLQDLIENDEPVPVPER